MKKFGNRMNGNEEAIESLFKSYLKSSRYRDFRYLEIGFAGGVTLRAIYDITRENINKKKWFLLGLELEEGYSINKQDLERNFKKNELYSVYNNKKPQVKNIAKCKRHVFLYMQKEPRKFIEEIEDQSLDIVLIDGCHGYNCWQADFFAVEPKIRKKGLLLSHDVGVFEQGTDFQLHCGEGINVRKAISDLGLWDNKRKNWKFVKEINGSRTTLVDLQDGNSVGVFRKVL